MSSTVRSALLGGGLALVLVAAVVALLVTGTVTLPDLKAGPLQQLLVIATAPDGDALTAPFAFVVRRDTASAELLDTSEPVVISGTSAESAAEAYPFVGGAGVARALADQTGGERLGWVVLPPDVWAGLVDEVGGLQIDLPAAVSVYRDGRLVVLEAGARKLDGEELVSLASALSYLEPAETRDQVVSQLSAGISAVVASRPERLTESVRAREAESSVDAETLEGFSAK